MARSERRLWSSAQVKAGQRRVRARPAVAMPSTTVAVSRTRATTPVARMVNQTVVEVAASITPPVLPDGLGPPARPRPSPRGRRLPPGGRRRRDR